MAAWIEPDWPAPAGIRAASTLRTGGTSLGPYASLNLGAHVGDDPDRVAENRRLLAAALHLPSEPVWLNQVHGRRAIRAEAPGDRTADAACTREPGVVCAVMTADCLPVLLCSLDGETVAAVHAGWKGLAGGVVETAVAALDTRDLLAWLGPAIGPEAFEVGGEVREAFLRKGDEFAHGFRATSGGKWLADIYRLGRLTLNRLGITEVYGGGRCTFGQADDFFSYRRDRITGRMATLIWRE
jgi:YfiH family protein